MNHNNNKHKQQSRLLSEGLNYKDLVGMLKPTIHVDEFSSKMGEDEDVIVLSFYLRDKQAAEDTVNWFEKGYDFVIDSEMSPGEIKPNRYLVYVEMKRRSNSGKKIKELLDDFSTLTEHDQAAWKMHYKGQTYPFTVENFNQVVPLTPDEYRRRTEKDLNEMRTASGLPVKSVYRREKDLQTLQSAAGII